MHALSSTDFINYINQVQPHFMGRPQTLTPFLMIMIESRGGHGTLKHLAPVLSLSETRPHWDKPSPVLGSSTPGWL